MKNYWILTRVMLRNMLSSLNPFAQTATDSQKKSRMVIRALLRLLVILFAVGSIIYLEYPISQAADAVGLPEIVLPAMAILASSAFALVIGLFQGLSELFQGKDAPFLAVLPLTSRQVFAARLTTLYLSELALDALLCLPAFVLYAMGTGSAMPTVLTALPTLLLLPLIPLSLVALVASLLMRISAFARNRDSVTMAISAILAIAYSLCVTMTNASDEDPAQSLIALLSQQGMLDRLGRFYPPIQWASQGFMGNIGMLALFALVSVAAAAAVILLVGPGYLNQALSSSEKTVIHRAKTGGSRWKKHGTLAALHALEWQELLRTPAWAYNSLFGVLMFPLMIAVGMFTGVSRGDPEGMAGFQQILLQVDPAYIALVLSGVLMFGSMVNPAVSTAISREGSRWSFALTFPVRQRTRFAAKLLVGLEINLVCSLLIAAVAWFIIPLNLGWLLAALGISFLVGLAAAAFSLWTDALNPHLQWASEMEAIKKNFNQVYGMLLWVVLVALCAVAAVLLWNRGSGIALAAVAGVALLEAVLALFLLSRVTEKNAVLQS